jgi:hypothetical protein
MNQSLTLTLGMLVGTALGAAAVNGLPALLLVSLNATAFFEETHLS